MAESDKTTMLAVLQLLRKYNLKVRLEKNNNIVYARIVYTKT